MFDKIWAFFSAIEGAGTEVIDEFFFSMGSGLFSKLLWGLLGLIVDIIWGILVYGSPIIIPVVIYKIISGNRLSKGISELANGLMKEVLTACEREGMHNIREFSGFFQENDCTIELNQAALILKTPAKSICTIPYSSVGYELEDDSSNLKKYLIKRLKKLGKAISRKLTIPCKVGIYSDVDAGMKGIGPSHIESELSSDGKTVISREVYNEYFGWRYVNNVSCRITPRHRTVKKMPEQDNGLKKI